MFKQSLALSLLLPLTIAQLTLLSLAGLLLLPVALFLKSYRRHLARQIEREVKNVEAIMSEAGERITHLDETDHAVLKARMTIVKLKGRPD
ncbi:MAG: hypothetical protein IPP57_24575 [Candidatus Obscuribacter sp.]|nr:hypothetical protein [Candidatus Obscuribacter sp.]MBK7838241.1 hypothetical protein [Candidatus Obscuribacter sp.]MBK9201248.1 hypothetical protein [Candidatus Obscuribacter sp.]MBK9621901.1 hypothetical protein [Candidatus Obscuribacter sp.]MBK9773954.1 hypothetical protein [Candidatus Obscuribacter sp.]